MKPPYRNIFLSLGGSLLAATSIHAADVTWDIAPGTVGVGDSAVTGGTGTWDTTNGNWTTDAGVNNVAWNNGNNDTALFGGTAGTVTLGTNINVSGMEFTSGGYTIAGGGNTITLGNNGGVRTTSVPGPSLVGSGTTTINADIDTNGFRFTTVNGTSLLNGVISGSGGFATYNSSNVTLSGANTYTGKTSITSDTTSGSSLTVSSFNSVNGGTPLMASSSLGAPTTVANGTIDISTPGKRASCTLTYTGTGETTDRVVKVNFNSSSSQTINASGSGLLKFTSAMTSNTINTQSGRLNLGGTGAGEFVQSLPTLAASGLRKSGNGTWTIGGGSVTRVEVTAGELIVTGTLTTTTATGITVSNGATLETGQFTVTDALILGGTSNTVMELGGTTIGTEYDNISINALGALTYGGNLSVENLGGFDMDLASQTYELFSLNGVSPTGNFNTVTVNGVLLSNSGGLWTGVNGAVDYAFNQSLGNLMITAVPEPSSAALLGLGGLFLLRRRRS